ncbi:unnamed protein product [Rhizophagus irregularis]|nr:unnamed protein product [Rhizophagus irregularis]
MEFEIGCPGCSEPYLSKFPQNQIPITSTTSNIPPPSIPTKSTTLIIPLPSIPTPSKSTPSMSTSSTTEYLQPHHQPHIYYTVYGIKEDKIMRIPVNNNTKPRWHFENFRDTITEGRKSRIL